MSPPPVSPPPVSPPPVSPPTVPPSQSGPPVVPIATYTLSMFALTAQPATAPHSVFKRSVIPLVTSGPVVVVKLYLVQLALNAIGLPSFKISVFVTPAVVDSENTCAIKTPPSPAAPSKSNEIVISLFGVTTPTPIFDCLIIINCASLAVKPPEYVSHLETASVALKTPLLPAMSVSQPVVSPVSKPPLVIKLSSSVPLPPIVPPSPPSTRTYKAISSM